LMGIADLPLQLFRRADLRLFDFLGRNARHRDAPLEDDRQYLLSLGSFNGRG
jgi:hypothetical protein